MTVGIISAVGRSLPTDLNAAGTTFTIPDIIQTDAPINPGNSGGVLVDDQGNLIGVTSAIESASGSHAGIGFAIPSSTVTRVIPELIKSGKFESAYLGVTGATLTPDLASAMGVDTNLRGVLVVDVASNGPADKAGLLGGSKQANINGESVNVGGDIITAIDGQPLTTIDDLISYLANHTVVGQSVKLTVQRNDAEKTFDATLVARPASVAQTASQATQQSQTNPSSSAWMGIAAMTMTPDIATKMGLAQDQKGVLIEEVETGSPADLAGLLGSFKPVIINSKRVMIGGDVITAIDGQSINTVEDLQQSMSAAQPGQDVTVTFLRDGKEQTAPVTLAEKPAN
jgi:S1-C subfamily serine protease